MSERLKTILCVDDDSDILELEKIALETFGKFKVILSHSGKDMLQRVEGISPDLILMDMVMPEMDGFSALKELRKNPALDATPVIFMTALAQTQDIEKYKAVGAAGVIIKPFDLATFLAQVGNLCKETKLKKIEPKWHKSDAYQTLHASYLLRLKKSAEAIDEILTQRTGVDLPRIRSLAHGLSGTGAAFGFKDVSNAGEKLEDFLENLPPFASDGETLSKSDLSAIQSLLSDLRAACKHATIA